ncbi:MAG: sulfur oxidation c-type cytochrome SoxX [Paracoccus sp. (in: a-proteobacteria)]|nr:sulfur oxidation c-type cytochrome SoxX [Paracoccus sp. (in: a-proteobacteria)]
MTIRQAIHAAAFLGVSGLAVGLGAAMAETAPEDVVWSEDGAIAQSLTGVPGDPVEGRRIMSVAALGNCVACHANGEMEDDVPFHGDIAPALDGVADRWDEAHLRGILADAKRTFPDSFMPGFYKTGPFIRVGVGYTGNAPEKPSDIGPILTGQQVEDIVAYLMTLTYQD